MRNYIFLFSTLLYLLISHETSAHQRFSKGYIITLKQDTLQGFIRQQPQKLYYKSFIFKNSSSGETIQYIPSEILGYGFNDSYDYISKKIYSKDSTEYNKAFIRRFYRGKVNLYEKGESFYFAEKENEFYFLGNSSELRGLNQEEKLRHKQRFTGLLILLFQEVALDLQPQIQKANLNKKSLAQIADIYHHKLFFNDDEYGLMIFRQNFSIKTTILTSYSHNLFTHNHRDVAAERVNMVPSNHWKAGVKFDFFLPALANNSSFYLSAVYEYFNGQTHANYGYSDGLPNGSYDIYIFANYSAISINGGISFPLNNFQVLFPSFIHVGLSNLLIFDAQIYEFNRPPNELGRINFNNHQKGEEIGRFNPGIDFGFFYIPYIQGINQRIKLTIGLEASFNLIPFEDQTLHQTSTGLKIGFRF